MCGNTEPVRVEEQRFFTSHRWHLTAAANRHINQHSFDESLSEAAVLLVRMAFGYLA